MAGVFAPLETSAWQAAFEVDDSFEALRKGYRDREEESSPHILPDFESMRRSDGRIAPNNPLRALSGPPQEPTQAQEIGNDVVSVSNLDGSACIHGHRCNSSSTKALHNSHSHSNSSSKQHFIDNASTWATATAATTPNARERDREGERERGHEEEEEEAGNLNLAIPNSLEERVKRLELIVTDIHWAQAVKASSTAFQALQEAQEAVSASQMSLELTREGEDAWRRELSRLEADSAKALAGIASKMASKEEVGISHQEVESIVERLTSPMLARVEEEAEANRRKLEETCSSICTKQLAADRDHFKASISEIDRRLASVTFQERDNSSNLSKRLDELRGLLELEQQRLRDVSETSSSRLESLEGNMKSVDDALSQVDTTVASCLHKAAFEAHLDEWREGRAKAEEDAAQLLQRVKGWEGTSNNLDSLLQSLCGRCSALEEVTTVLEREHLQVKEEERLKREREEEERLQLEQEEKDQEKRAQQGKDTSDEAIKEDAMKTQEGRSSSASLTEAQLEELRACVQASEECARATTEELSAIKEVLDQVPTALRTIAREEAGEALQQLGSRLEALIEAMRKASASEAAKAAREAVASLVPQQQQQKELVSGSACSAAKTLRTAGRPLAHSPARQEVLDAGTHNSEVAASPPLRAPSPLLRRDLGLGPATDGRGGAGGGGGGGGGSRNGSNSSNGSGDAAQASDSTAVAHFFGRELVPRSPSEPAAVTVFHHPTEPMQVLSNSPGPRPYSARMAR